MENTAIPAARPFAHEREGRDKRGKAVRWTEEQLSICGRRRRDLEKRQGKRRYVLLAVFSLLIGMAVYFLFRNTAMLLFAWFPKLAWLNRVYIRLNPKENVFLSIALYSIPDGLWLFSGLCGIRALWWSDQKTGRVYAAGFCLLALCFETLQMFDSVPGTFDVIDLAVLIFFAFLEGVMFQWFIKRSIS